MAERHIIPPRIRGKLEKMRRNIKNIYEIRSGSPLDSAYSEFGGVHGYDITLETVRSILGAEITALRKLKPSDDNGSEIERIAKMLPLQYYGHFRNSALHFQMRYNYWNDKAVDENDEKRKAEYRRRKIACRQTKILLIEGMNRSKRSSKLNYHKIGLRDSKNAG